MPMVKAKCIQCGSELYIPEFQVGGEGCPDCLAKTGKKFAKSHNRGLLKTKRIGKRMKERLER